MIPFIEISWWLLIVLVVADFCIEFMKDCTKANPIRIISGILADLIIYGWKFGFLIAIRKYLPF